MALSNAVLGIFQLVVSILFAILALYLGFAILKRMTRNIAGEDELARGNPAVGVLVAAVFLAIAIIVQSGVSGLSVGINKAISAGILTPDGMIAIGTATLQLILGIILAVIAIYLALMTLDRLTGRNISQFEAIREGNVAVALEVAGMIFAVAVIIQSGVIGITAAFG